MTSLLSKNSGLKTPHSQVGLGLCLGDPEVSAKGPAISLRSIFSLRTGRVSQERREEKVLTRMRVAGQKANQLASCGWRQIALPNREADSISNGVFLLPANLGETYGT